MTQDTLVTPSGFIRQKRWRGLGYAGLLLLLLLALEATIYQSLKGRLLEEKQAAYQAELAAMVTFFERELHLVGSDLAYITRSSLVQQALLDQQPQAIDHLADLMMTVSAVQQRYDQVRLLDRHGHEFIRINLCQQGCVRVGHEELQDKQNRYYFQDALDLAAGQLSVSRFDLNVEGGVIERPFKPMLRFSAPIYVDDRLVGVGVLNYLGSRLLDHLEMMGDHGGEQLFLLNKEGFYLQSPAADQQWGFMLASRKEHTFGRDYPEAWHQMQGREQGHLQGETGEFFFVHLNLAPPAPFVAKKSDRVSLVVFVPKELVRQELRNLIFGLKLGFYILAPLLTFLGWQLGNYQVHQKWLFHALEMEATHDSLTGLYNRKAIFDILRRSMQLARRNKSPLSICFVDVNDLKKVNDGVGHETGDKMIKGAADTIQAVIRSSDSAARIGGDEFLVIFPDCQDGDVERIMTRVEKQYRQLGMEVMGMEWCLSFGCTQMDPEEDTPEKLVERADERMYVHKHMTKCGKSPAAGSP